MIRLTAKLDPQSSCDVTLTLTYEQRVKSRLRAVLDNGREVGVFLVSPSLPVGAFTYSGGIEWAVEAGWVRRVGDLESWLSDQLHNGLVPLDLPIAMRMHRAADDGDPDAMGRWVDWLLAALDDEDIGASSPALAIASSAHEQQYTRLFRS